jgi:outer membrane protein, heavy metal efflux system
VWCFVIGAALAAPLTVDDVVQRALESSPSAVAAEGEVEALRGLRRSRSIFLQNPVVEVEAQSGVVNGEAIQPLSLTGEGWAARREARELTDAAEASRDRTLLEIAADARLAWASAVLTSERDRAARNSLELATRLRTAIEERARVGEASGLEAALARAGEAEAVARTLEARSAGTDALVYLARFHPDALDLGVAGDATAAVPPSSSSSAERSDLRAAAATVDARAAGLRRERASALPAVGVGAVFDAEGNVGPKAVVEVPLWTWNQAGIGEARAALASASVELETLRAEVAAEQRLGTEQAADARTLGVRLEGFETQSDEALRFVSLAFERGELSVQEVVLLQGELLDGRLAALDAEALIIAMEIEALLAVDDPSLLAGGVR